jgi:hypothetical protein
LATCTNPKPSPPSATASSEPSICSCPPNQYVTARPIDASAVTPNASAVRLVAFFS